MKTKSVSWCSDPVNVVGVSPLDYETETAFHIYCADWLRKRYKITGESRFTRWHHSANEREGARSGLRAKLMGQSKGMPDLIHYGSRIVIELKIRDREVTKEQLEWLMYFKSIGWNCYTVRTFEQFQAIVLSCNNHKREVERND